MNILLISIVYKIIPLAEPSSTAMNPKRQNAPFANPKRNRSNHSRTQNESSRIIGGEYAEPGDYPFIVSLLNIKTSAHFCGGSLVHTTKVLTACHCLAEPGRPWFFRYKIKHPSSILARAGTASQHYWEGRSENAKYVHIHPDCSLITLVSDFGLVILHCPLAPVSGTLEPLESLDVTTGYVDRLIDEKTECSTAGWGSTSPDGASTYDLMKVRVHLVPDDECSVLIKKEQSLPIFSFKPQLQLCTLGVENDGDAPCKGDSGGPLICHGRLVGIVSWSFKCKSASVYSRIDVGLDWIVSTEGTGAVITVAANYRQAFGIALLTLAVHKYREYFSYVD